MGGKTKSKLLCCGKLSRCAYLALKNDGSRLRLRLDALPLCVSEWLNCQGSGASEHEVAAQSWFADAKLIRSRYRIRWKELPMSLSRPLIPDLA
jgi:hypothetical protein